jgi:hypothetical protein
MPKTEKTLKDYILTATKEYTYRLKFAFPLTEENLATIEKCAAKYVLKDITKPNRIILQKNPLDFKNVDCAEVTFLDVVVEYPASTELFHQELRQRLGVAEKLVVVRDKEHDPYEKEIAAINTRKEVEEKGEYVTKLLDPEYKSDGHTEEQAPTHYGNEYNEKFLDTLDEVRAAVKKKITKTVGKETKKAEDYNKEVKKGKGSKSPFNTIKLPPMPEPNKGK